MVVVRDFLFATKFRLTLGFTYVLICTVGTQGFLASLSLGKVAVERILPTSVYG